MLNFANRSGDVDGAGIKVRLHQRLCRVVRLAAASGYAYAARLILRGRTAVGLENTVEADSDVDCCLSNPLKRVEKLVERPCTLCLVVITDLRDEICFISQAKLTIHNCTRLEDLVRSRKATHSTR